jgi:hypothetical protein
MFKGDGVMPVPHHAIPVLVETILGVQDNMDPVAKRLAHIPNSDRPPARPF